MNTRRYLQFRKYPFFVCRLAKSAIEITKDTLFVPKKFNFNFWQFKALLKLKRQELTPYYAEYTMQVSGDFIAISLELAAFILALCEILKPAKILDLGSGFSSFVFRYYQNITELKPIVWSIDDSVEWLSQTTQFLKRHNLSSENLIIWGDFLKYKCDKFDLILHDLGNMDLRKATFKDVLLALKPDGFLILDDIHKYETFVRNFFKETNYQYYNMKYYTKDKFNRYSFLVSKSEQLL